MEMGNDERWHRVCACCVGLLRVTLVPVKQTLRVPTAPPGSLLPGAGSAFWPQPPPMSLRPPHTRMLRAEKPYLKKEMVCKRLHSRGETKEWQQV